MKYAKSATQAGRGCNDKSIANAQEPNAFLTCEAHSISYYYSFFLSFSIPIPNNLQQL